MFTNGVKTTNTTSSSVTVYETGAGSSSYKGESVNVQVFPSGLSVNTNFTVVKANISWPAEGIGVRSTFPIPLKNPLPRMPHRAAGIGFR